LDLVTINDIVRTNIRHSYRSKYLRKVELGMRRRRRGGRRGRTGKRSIGVRISEHIVASRDRLEVLVNVVIRLLGELDDLFDVVVAGLLRLGAGNPITLLLRLLDHGVLPGGQLADTSLEAKGLEDTTPLQQFTALKLRSLRRGSTSARVLQINRRLRLQLMVGVVSVVRVRVGVEVVFTLLVGEVASHQVLVVLAATEGRTSGSRGSTSRGSSGRTNRTGSRRYGRVTEGRG